MNNLFNTNKLMDRFFRHVDGVVWDLMSGRIGIKTNDGITTLEGTGDDASVTINLLDQFGMEVPAFAQNTPVDAITTGDLIYGARGPLGWVVAKNEKSFTLLKADGTRTTWSPPKVQMLGFDGGAMVLRSLINVLPGGNTGLANFQSMLMPMLMMGDGDIDFKKILPIMLMSQVGADPANPSGNGMNGIVQTMMLMSMFNKGNSKTSGPNFFDRGGPLDR